MNQQSNAVIVTELVSFMLTMSQQDHTIVECIACLLLRPHLKLAASGLKEETVQ